MARVDRYFDLVHAPEGANDAWAHHAARRGALVVPRRHSGKSGYAHHLMDEILTADLDGRNQTRRQRRDRLAERALRHVFSSALSGKRSFAERASEVLERDEKTYEDWVEVDTGFTLKKSAKVSLTGSKDLFKPQDAQFPEPNQPAFGSLFEHKAVPLFTLANYLTRDIRPVSEMLAYFPTSLKVEDSHRPEPSAVPTWHEYSPSAFSGLAITNARLREFIEGFPGKKMPSIPIARVDNLLGEPQMEVRYIPKNAKQLGPVVSESNLGKGGEYKGIRAPEGQLEIIWNGINTEINLSQITAVIFSIRGLAHIFPFHRLSNAELKNRTRQLEAERAAAKMRLLQEIFA